MMAAVGRRVWLAVLTVIRAVRKAHREQVYMWECLALSSRAAPASATGRLRWVPSLDGYRLVGSHLPAQDPDGRRPLSASWPICPAVASGFVTSRLRLGKMAGYRGRELSPGGNVQLGEYVGQVSLHSPPRNVEPVADLRVG